jgi:hypothetical protein
MANGTVCCALEICCNAAARRKKIANKISAATSAEAEYCEKFLDWMEAEGLIFAPASFGPVMQEIAAMARKHPVVDEG